MHFKMQFIPVMAKLLFQTFIIIIIIIINVKQSCF